MNSYSERRENAINILRIKGGRVLISPMGVYMASSLAALTKFSHVERITSVAHSCGCEVCSQ